MGSLIIFLLAVTGQVPVRTKVALRVIWYQMYKRAGGVRWEHAWHWGNQVKPQSHVPPEGICQVTHNPEGHFFLTSSRQTQGNHTVTTQPLSMSWQFKKSTSTIHFLSHLRCPSAYRSRQIKINFAFKKSCLFLTLSVCSFAGDTFFRNESS